MARGALPMRRARGAGAAKYVSLKVNKRLLVDVKGHAEHILNATIENIRALAARGRGYEGALPGLKDSTVDRYLDDGKSSGTKSLLRRTGHLLDGLRGTVQVLVQAMRARVKIMGPFGDNRKIGFVGARRPFLGLSTGDLRRIATAGRKVKMKSAAPPPGFTRS